MASLSDEITNKIISEAPDKTLKALKETKQALKGTAHGAGKVGHVAASGVVIILRRPFLTANTVMKSIGDMMANNNGRVEYSKNNVDMGKLYESGGVSRLDEAISKDVMKYFNKYCKQNGIKYSVLKDASTDTYYLFFKSKELEAINTILQQSYKDYMNERSRQDSKERGLDRGKKKCTE